MKAIAKHQVKKAIDLTVLLQTQSFPCILNSTAVWVVERCITVVLLFLTKRFTSCFGCATEMTEWS